MASKMSRGYRVWRLLALAALLAVALGQEAAPVRPSGSSSGSSGRTYDVSLSSGSSASGGSSTQSSEQSEASVQADSSVKAAPTGQIGPKNGEPSKAELEAAREIAKKADQLARAKAEEQRLKALPDCSQPRTESTCGDPKLPCYGLGSCKETGMRCDGKARVTLFNCVCPENRRGRECESDAVTKHVKLCQDKNECGGRGQCVPMRTVRTSAGWTVFHGCECDEGFGGKTCDLRVAVAVGETPDGELVQSIPNNGGYFAFRQIFETKRRV